jgi:cytidine deaminase
VLVRPIISCIAVVPYNLLMGLLSLKDVVRCPQCGGADIVYSCEPKCCFNHVCAECRSTFELNTTKTGQIDPIFVENEEPESGDPTTGCASCGSLHMAVLCSNVDETILVCGKCQALSKLVVEEFVPGVF